MLYFAEKLSPHMALSAEGYLICRGVPVARSGTQVYLPAELNLPPGDPVPVDRPEEEVFSPACVASFEGKPVTEDHPDIPEGVVAENIRLYQKGHAQNIRRGRGGQRHLLLADLVITDPETIRHIRSGKREISCGYTYTLSEENGRWVQRGIRGNHIAVVDRGRAGPRVCIRDRDPVPVSPAANRKERSLNPMKTVKTAKPAAAKAAPSPAGVLSRLVASAVRACDLAPEDMPAVVHLMEAAAELAPAAEAAETETPVSLTRTEIVLDPSAEPEAEDLPAADTDPEILSRLDRIISLLEALAPPAADEDPDAPEELLPEAEAVAGEAERLEAAVAELLSAAGEGEAEAGETEALPADADADEDPDRGGFLPASDRMIRSAVRALKPVIARLPKEQAAAAADAALKAMRSAVRDSGSRHPARGGYAALSAAASRRDPAELGRRIIQSRNINCRK